MIFPYTFEITTDLFTFRPQTQEKSLILPNKIAGFDLDGTLIRPLPGRSTFDRDPGNWQWWNPMVVERLQELVKEGFAIVIFTNQGGWSTKTVQKEGANNKLVQKFTRILAELGTYGVTVTLYAAVGRQSSYRKPSPAMYHQYLVDHGLDRGTITESFFCGDAAGRPSDHSDSDKLFAQSAGMVFFTPEEIFPQEQMSVPIEAPRMMTAPSTVLPLSSHVVSAITQDTSDLILEGPMPYTNPPTQSQTIQVPQSDLIIETPLLSNVVTDSTALKSMASTDSLQARTTTFSGDNTVTNAVNQELILTVGYPGSGKTTYLEQHYTPNPSYRVISQDYLPSSGALRRSRDLNSVVAEVNGALDAGLSVVVDRTHMTEESRAPFVALAQRKGVPVKFLVWETDLETAYQRNVARNEANPQIPKISKIVYYKMRKNYQPPTPVKGQVLLLS